MGRDVGDDGRAKITDFGLAKLRQQTKSIYTDKVRGSLPWMAPELFDRRPKVSEKSDVYAYGMVLWEIASRKTPFNDAHDPNLIPSWVKADEREEIPFDCPKPFSDMIQHCWRASSKERPTAFEVKTALEKARPQSSTESLQTVATSTQNPPGKESLAPSTSLPSRACAPFRGIAVRCMPSPISVESSLLADLAIRRSRFGACPTKLDNSIPFS